MDNIFSQWLALCAEIGQGRYAAARALCRLSPQLTEPETSLSASQINTLDQTLAAMLARVEGRETELNHLLQRLRRAHEAGRRRQYQLAADNRQIRACWRREALLSPPLARDPAMGAILEQAQQAALQNANLVISGEAGSGKNHLARYIHGLSARAPKPFVPVSCRDMAAPLLQTELFGHSGGQGRLQQAEGGALFIDAIDAMPMKLQARMLRALRSCRRRMRAGGSAPDTRIIASTHKDLQDQIKAQKFYAPLLRRLNARSLRLPPLRRRRQDIPVLTQIFLAELAAHYPFAVTAIAPEAMQRLCHYHWPGNISELKSELEKAAFVASGEMIDAGDLSPRLAAAASGQEQNWVPEPAPGARLEAASHDDILQLLAQGKLEEEALSLERVEREHIKYVLQLSGGNKSLSARLLGISREGLRLKLKTGGYDA
jgi:DNA-binding NtrC family response regulator